MFLRGVIVVLCAVGLWDALYFTLAYYGRVRRARWVPAILCARQGSNCVTVVQTPYAQVFGVQNSLLGIVYYVLMLTWATVGQSVGFEFRLGATDYTLTFAGFLLAASAVSVALGFYLIYSLLKKLHTHCPLCYTAHAINGVLLALLILMS